MNIAFISHCDFSGNSAMHLFSIANELAFLGCDSVICVPNDPDTLRAHGRPSFHVVPHDKASVHPLVFTDGRGPDLVHAWTPRELVRKVTLAVAERHAVPYLVHLEDNEQVILEDDLAGCPTAELRALPASLLDQLVPLHRTHPVRGPDFIASSAGVTALMDRLLEHAPAAVPTLVFWPGFDRSFADAASDEGYRRRLGVGPQDALIPYTGNLHASNVVETTSLIAGLAALRRLGLPVKLVKTGWTFSDVPLFRRGVEDGWIVDAGFIPREDVPRLVASSDVLVQPGRPGPFDDFRFPSKLPEYLASGRPVVLPATNIGRFLHDGVDCVLLERGHALEIAACVRRLLGDPARASAIGRAGREFALAHLTWTQAAQKLKAFYDMILTRPQSEAPRGPHAARPAPAPDRPPLRPVAPPRLIAFYLPQFHRIPENDEWWGDGFTEWTNIRRAEPNYRGHEQPLRPAELGYYDLAEPGVMERQATLARSYGIHGFCFYYYWFDRRRLLERPLDDFLRRGAPDLPFCVCWANENWSRRWDGSEEEVLMRQDYRDGYAGRFIHDVLPMLRDPRYIEVDGAPILLVYRADLLPDAGEAVQVWRDACARAGIPHIHLAAVQSFGITDPRVYGFDAAVEFPPHVRRHLIDPEQLSDVPDDFEGHFEDYGAIARDKLDEPAPPYVRYRGVMPAWDNTPRRLRRAHVCVNAAPETYRQWVSGAVADALRRGAVQEPLVFVNAWNEWAEGAFLEPDHAGGRSRLEATADGLVDGLTAACAARGIPATRDAVRTSLVRDGVLVEDGR